MVAFELLIGRICAHFQNHDAKGTHEESPVDHFMSLVCARAVVENFVFRVSLISEKSGQFTAVPVHHGEIQRSKVFVEREISEISINVEEKCVFEVLRRLHIRYPVQLVCTKIVSLESKRTYLE